MSGDVQVCTITPEALSKVKKFRLRRNAANCAIVFKINPENLLIDIEEEYEDTSLDELREELPAHQPRYIIFSYQLKHSDGRVSYPLCFIYLSPAGTKPEMSMMYAGSKLGFIQKAELTKIYELRNVEELTEEWLVEKLQKR